MVKIIGRENTFRAKLLLSNNLNKMVNTRGNLLLCPVLLLTSILSSCFPHPSEITNLNDYINPLTGCVLHLLNYENIEIPSVIRIPYITSRVLVLPYCRTDSSTRVRQTTTEVIPLNKGSKQLNVFCLQRPFIPSNSLLSTKSQQRGWNCLTRIYIFPPQSMGFNSVPFMFEEEFVWAKRHVTDDSTYPRSQYHILVHEKDYSFQQWNLGMNTIIRFNEKIEILYWKVTTRLEHPEMFSIVEINFVCKFSQLYFRSLRLGSSHPMFLSEIETRTSYLNTISYLFPFHIFFLNEKKWADVESVKAPKFWEFKTRRLDAAKVLVSLLLDKLNNSKTATQEIFMRGFIPPFYASRTTCSGKFSRESKSPFCDRMEGTIPSIVLNCESNIKIPLRFRLFTFFTSIDRLHRRISIDTILHVYDILTWTGIFVTATFIPLIVVAVIGPRYHNVLEYLCMGFSILLEQGTNALDHGSKRVCMFLLLGPWILMYLIITNAFRGDNVTNALHPLRTVSIATFAHVIQRNSTAFSDFIEISYPLPQSSTEFYFLLQDFNTYQTSFYSSFITEDRHTYLSKNLQFGYPGMGEDTRWQLSSLSESAIKGRAFLGWSDDLERLLSLARSRFPKIAWQMGTEYLTRMAYGLELRHISNPMLLSRIGGLFQSGIPEKWIWYRDNSPNYNSRNAADKTVSSLPKALNLEENTFDIFNY